MNKTMNGTFSTHRRSLMRRLPDGLILLAGGREVPRNYDVNYVFRQGSDFLWLSGVEEPGCALLMDPKRGSTTLFMPRIDDHHRVWEGHVPSPAEARRLFGVERVAYTDELPAALSRARRGHRRAYADPAALKSWSGALRGLKGSPAVLGDAIEELRAVKDAGELALMRRANEVSGAAHSEVMRRARAGMREYQVQALFEAPCIAAGLRHLAYPSIVATGVNGAVLHYRRNDALLRRGQLLLIDAGAENRGYAADITRTFPVSARFTRRQADVYDVVLGTQKALIDAARPGVNSAEWHVLSMRLIAEGLRGLGLLRGSTDALVETGAVRLFYPHGIGHLLGLDVHDGLGGKSRRLPNPTKAPVRFVARLEAGMAVTVEPGVYFIEALINSQAQRAKHRAHVDFSRAERWLDFGGIRIEDDVLVRPSGPPLNLTTVPKERRAVEELRKAAGGA
ncbi:MAG: aminopeptidase P family protein [Elusimicrobia bacterium]|nr:aminopeptidase P family protein [Elusimicrobiota bacterium]